MFQRDKLKYFDKFLEDKKISNLNKTIKLCGYKKHKMKSLYSVNNAFGVKTQADLTKIKEIVLSFTRKIDKLVYDSEKFNDAVNTYIVYCNSQIVLSGDKLSSYIKYIQENLVNFKNCNIAIFIYNNSIYAINEKVFNGVSTFVESFKWSRKL